MWPLVLATAVPSLAGEEPARKGHDAIFVRTIKSGSPPERAGLMVGDRLLRWRAPANAATPEAAGEFRTHQDAYMLEFEAAARGAAQVVIERGGREMTLSIEPGAWSLANRPWLPPDLEAVFVAGKERFDRNDPEGGSAAWRQAADALVERDLPLAASWLHELLVDSAVSLRQLDLVEKDAVTVTRLAEKVGDRSLLAVTWEWRAGISFLCGDLDAAVHAAERAIELWEKDEGHRFQLARALISLARVHSNRGEIQPAEELLQRALQLARKGRPESWMEGDVRSQLGVAWWWKGDLDGAEEQFQQALAIHHRLDPGGVAEGFDRNALGNVSQKKGDLAAAETHFAESLAIHRMHDPHSMDTATSLINLGLVAYYRGALSEAEDYYRQAVAIFLELDPDGRLHSEVLQNLGIVAMERGDLAAAEELFAYSTTILNRLAPDSLIVANCLTNSAVVAHAQGDLQRALELSERELELRQRLSPDSLDVALTLANLGTFFRENGDRDRAAEFGLRAKAIREKLAPGGLAVADSLYNLGLLAHDGGKREEAERLYRESLTLFRRQSAQSIFTSLVLSHLGDLVLAGNRLAEAEEILIEALEIQQRLAPGSWAEAETLHALGRLEVRRQRLQEACRFYRRAVGAVEAQKSRLGGGKKAAELFAERYADFYRDLVQMQVQLGRTSEAFHSLEKYRVQLLLRMLAERDLDFSAEAPKELLREEQIILVESRRLEETLSASNAALEADQLDQQLARWRQLKDELDVVRERIRQASPRLAELRYPEAADVTQARALLGPETLLLSFCTGRESTHVFVVLGDRLEVFAIPIGREALARRVRAFAGLMKSPSGNRARLEDMSQELFDLLLEPARSWIEGARRVVVCADGPLHWLPFSALRADRERFLIDWKPVSTILSATILRENLGTRPPAAFAQQVIAFGDPLYSVSDPESLSGIVRRAMADRTSLPSLPATRAEVAGICRLYPDSSRGLTGADASEAEAKKLGNQTRFIHFACHGLVNEASPLDSCLILSLPRDGAYPDNDGLLQAWEVFESIRIDADLVVLSACQTGLGREAGGEGIIGLVRAFLYAGSRAVMASLWEVADDSTAVLMQRFYAHMKGGAAKDEALRLAIHDLRAAPIAEHGGEGAPPAEGIDASHPYFWAGFFICGDWS